MFSLSLATVAMLAAAFVGGLLLGFLATYLLLRAEVRKTKDRNRSQQLTIAALQADAHTLAQKVAVREAEYAQAVRERDALATRVATHAQTLALAQAENERIRHNLIAADEREQDWMQQFAAVRQTAKTQQTDAAAVHSQLQKSLKEADTLRLRLLDVHSGDAELHTQLEESAARIAALEQEAKAIRYTQTLLMQERDDLAETLHKLQQTTPDTSEDHRTLEAHSESNKVYVFTTPPDANGVSAELHLTPKEAQARLATLIGERIPRASVEQRDDLKRINGIGPFIAEKLNSVGIYTFEQITYFDDNFIYILTAAIGFFPDRIKRGRWVEQAKELWEEKEYSRLELPKHSADSGVNY